MCHGCWEKAGSPVNDTPAVREATQLMDVVYEYACTGGALHIVLDDYNVSDGDLDFCTEVIGKNDHNPIEGQLGAEAACCEAFKKLTLDERMSAVHRAWETVASA